METGRGGCALVLATVLVASAALAGCTGAGPGGGTQVAQAAADRAGCTDASGAQSEPGSFQYGGAVSCKTETETFDWQNPSPRAQIQYGSTLTEGRLSIEVQDAAGRTVYEGTATSNDTDVEGRQEPTDPGVPADPAGALPWTVELTFENVTGTLGIQVTATQ